MATQYGSDAQITGSLEVDGDIILGSGDDDITLDSNTLFVDADNNRVGIGTASPDYELDVAGSIGLDEYVYHNGDTDTFIRFEADQITAKAGNISFINITEDDSQDKISFNEGRADVDFIVRSPNEALALYLNSDNEVFHINHGESAFKTKVHSTNGEAITVNNSGVILNEDGTAANDFRVESDGEDEALFVDASSNTLYINKGATGFTTVIKSTNEEAIRVGASGVILNQYGHASNDFRVESDDDDHMLFVDAGNSRIGIGTSSPATALDIDGNTTLGGGLVYGSETLTNSNNGGNVATGTPFSMVTSAAGATAVTLGNASIDGQTKIIVCTGHGGGMSHFGVNVTAASWAGGSGAISFTASPAFVQLVWGNSLWWVIGSSDSGLTFT